MALYSINASNKNKSFIKFELKQSLSEAYTVYDLYVATCKDLIKIFPDSITVTLQEFKADKFVTIDGKVINHTS